MKPARGCSSHRGLTLTEVLVVIVVLVILAVVLWPAVRRDRAQPGRFVCDSNLKQIGMAFLIWADDHGNALPMRISTNAGGSLEFADGGSAAPHFQTLAKELRDPRLLICPTDRRTAAASLAALQNTNLSYFVAVDAAKTEPAMLLAGDRNLTTNGVPAQPGLQALDPATVKSTGWSAALHNGSGNLLLSDGRVQWQSPAAAKTPGLSGWNGTNLIRLAIP